MDDLTITTKSVPGARWILKGQERLIRWARMSFKPAKSRSVVLKKRTSTSQPSQRTLLKVSGRYLT